MSTTTTAAIAVPTGTWVADAAHSKVGFSVKHLGIATVRGEFAQFEGRLEIPADPSAATATGVIQVASVDTKESQRDDHLRSPDFFDAERFPELTFTSTAIEALDEETFRITGDLTLHGVTREIVL